jgi:hypothetical protein
VKISALTAYRFKPFSFCCPRVLGTLCLCLAFVLLVACSGDDNSPALTPSIIATRPAGTTPIVTTVTPVSCAPQLHGCFVPPTLPVMPTPGPPLSEVTGLFVEPRATTPTRRSTLPTQQPSTLPPHDGVSVTVYDVVENKHYVFEHGIPGSFSGDRFLYVATGGASAGNVWLVDLKTGAKRSLGKGVSPVFIDANTVVAFLVGNERVVIELDTNQRRDLIDVPEPRRGEIERIADSRTYYRMVHAADGTALRVRNAFATPGLPPPDDCKAATDRFCDMRRAEEFIVSDARFGTVFRLRAHRVESGAPGEMLVATSPQCDDGGRLVWCGEVLDRLPPPIAGQPTTIKGTTNIFAVDIATGAARFIATARYEPNSLYFGSVNWPLSGDANFIAWTEAACSNPPGRLRVLYRKSGAITEADLPAWITLQAGKMGIGPFGAHYLVEPDSLRHIVSLPLVMGDVRWSDDYRYAAVGQPLGHGGTC